MIKTKFSYQDLKSEGISMLEHTLGKRDSQKLTRNIVAKGDGTYKPSVYEVEFSKSTLEQLFSSILEVGIVYHLGIKNNPMQNLEKILLDLETDDTDSSICLSKLSNVFYTLWGREDNEVNLKTALYNKTEALFENHSKAAIKRFIGCVDYFTIYSKSSKKLLEPISQDDKSKLISWFIGIAADTMLAEVFLKESTKVSELLRSITYFIHYKVSPKDSEKMSISMDPCLFPISFLYLTRSFLQIEDQTQQHKHVAYTGELFTHMLKIGITIGDIQRAVNKLLDQNKEPEEPKTDLISELTIEDKKCMVYGQTIVSLNYLIEILNQASKDELISKEILEEFEQQLSSVIVKSKLLHKEILGDRPENEI